MSTLSPGGRSVLIRAGGLHSPDVDRLRLLHLSCPEAIASGDRRVQAAIACLAAAYSATMTVADLATGGAGDAEVLLCGALLKLVLAGRVGMSAVALRAGLATQERPTLWRVARAEALAGQPWLTSPRHTAVPANKALAALLPHLDGTRNLAAPRRAAPCRVVPEPQLDEALHHLARHALLKPGTAWNLRPTASGK